MFRLSSFPPIQRQVLVTGCSSGIGRATAVILRKHGWKVFPTARHDKDLYELQSLGFVPVKLDLANPDSVENAVKEVLTLSNGTLGGLVNNAGVAQFGAVEDLTREALRRQFEVNTLGTQDLTNRLIPCFQKQKCGRIVNVSSVYGRVTAPMVGAYCASKYAMEALSDAMRIELRDLGIAVSLIEPGPIMSAFREKSANHSLDTMQVHESRFGRRYQRRLQKAERGQENTFFTKPPEAVAERIFHALTSPRPKSRYCVTLPAYLGAFMRRFASDGLIDAMLAKSARV